MDLPIDEVRGHFEEALSESGPTTVVAPTGSGKSTRLPIWMAEALGGPVVVVEPRRVACRSVAEFLAKQRGEEAGETFGYRVRFDDTTSDRTQVLYATTGVVLRMLADAVGDGEWPFAGVMIDEFHERGWEVDVIAAALLRDNKQEGESVFGPLVLTSATLNADRIHREVGGSLVEAEGRTYPVEIEYCDEPPAPTKRDIDRRVKQAVESVVTDPNDDGGDILVFLPGKSSIGDCERALQGVSDEYNFDVLQVHGRLPPSKMSEAFRDEYPRRRVYLSTNVSETSVTLPGVTTVIDSGLVKMRKHRGGRSALALTSTSEASMDQRAGRAGRVKPGRCIRLWSQRHRPAATTPPEVERIELDEVMLHAASCGLEGKAFDDAPWVDAPPAFALEEARDRLKRVGAIGDSGELTEKGYRLAQLPVDAHDARMLIDPPEALRGVLADLVALLQRSTNMVLPLGAVEDVGSVKQHRRELLQGCHDEVYTEVLCLRGGYPREHGLHRSAWEEARKVSASLREIIDAPARHPDDDTLKLPDRSELAAYLLERVPEMAFVLRERAKKRRRDGSPKLGRSEPWTNGEVELDVYPYEPDYDWRAQDEDLEHPEAGLILDLFWIGDDQGTGVRGVGNMLLPCDRRQFAQAGLGELEVGSVDLDKHSTPPTIEAQVERKLAEVTLSSRREELEGRSLCREVARLVLENRLLSGAAEQVRDDLHVWRVMNEWPERDRHWEPVEEVPDVETHLRERLWSVGVRISDDLMLVEPEDLRVNVADELGVMAVTVEGFCEDFPRVWEHMGRRYVCNVQPSTKKVILEPANSEAKSGSDPKGKHLPRFRGFDVFFRNASRVVPVRT
jgi:ATP-dependent helicase HrpB